MLWFPCNRFEVIWPSTTHVSAKVSEVRVTKKYLSENDYHIVNLLSLTVLWELKPENTIEVNDLHIMSNKNIGAMAGCTQMKY